MRLSKNIIFSQSTRRTQRKESIKLVFSVNSVLSVRDIFFAFTQPQSYLFFNFLATLLFFLINLEGSELAKSKKEKMLVRNEIVKTVPVAIAQNKDKPLTLEKLIDGINKNFSQLFLVKYSPIPCFFFKSPTFIALLF